MDGHRPRKRFGQNFLRDARIVDEIVGLIRPTPRQDIVEIGPGQGALTRPLLASGARLTVVELDRDLVPGLERLAPPSASYRIRQQDALTLRLDDLDSPPRRYRIVGNLPYNISTPLIFHLLGQTDRIEDMHFMLQKEVVERMAATPGGRDYGRLSVMVQHHCAVEPLLEVGPEAFVPRPKVRSAIVRLRPLETTGEVDRRAFETVVRQAFSQRRKTLRNTLRGLLEEDRIQACGIDPGLRPERLGVAEFEALARELAPDPRET